MRTVSVGMTGTLIRLIVDESKWLTLSMAVAFSAVSLLLLRTHSRYPLGGRVGAAMNLYFGTMIGTMAFGHLLAVTTKLALGTLEGSLAVFYAIGLALALPAGCLLVHVPAVLSGESHRSKTLALNAWLVLTLLALGLHNLPLAAPGLFDAGYALYRRPWVGWIVVGLALAASLGLFSASLVFLASGQSFEQFSR